MSYCDKPNIFSIYNIELFDIANLDKGHAKNYKVSCTGGCGSVSLEVNSTSGRPDLFAGYVQGFTLFYC